MKDAAAGELSMSGYLKLHAIFTMECHKINANFTMLELELEEMRGPVLVAADWLKTRCLARDAIRPQFVDY